MFEGATAHSSFTQLFWAFALLSLVASPTASQVMIDSWTTFSAQINTIDGALPKEMEINFYRIVQECVNNIMKHSQAVHAAVRVELVQGRLTVEVQDDGKGFASASAKLDPPREGFGLIGIFERAQLLGGEASVQSAPGQGATVTVVIPLKSTV